MAWAVPEQCCGAIEKIIGFSLKQFYADAIEPMHSVKVRAILGPIQMRTGQYTLRQMSKPISSFSLTGGNVCVAQRLVHSAERVRSSFSWNKWKSQSGVEYVAATNLRILSSHLEAVACTLQQGTKAKNLPSRCLCTDIYIYIYKIRCLCSLSCG